MFPYTHTLTLTTRKEVDAFLRTWEERPKPPPKPALLCSVCGSPTGRKWQCDLHWAEYRRAYQREYKRAHRAARKQGNSRRAYAKGKQRAEVMA